MERDEVYRTLGKVHMAKWFSDRLSQFAIEYPDTLAMTPAIFRTYLAQMLEDAMEEVRNGTRSLDPIQISA